MRDLPDENKPPPGKSDQVMVRQINSLTSRMKLLEEELKTFKEDEFKILQEDHEDKTNKYDEDFKKLFKKTIFESQPFHKNFHEEFKKLKF